MKINFAFFYLIPLGALLVPLVNPEITHCQTTNATSKFEERQPSKVVLLGTGYPTPDPERSGPAVAIIVKDTPYIVDLGPGIVRRAAAAYNAGIEALKVPNLTRAFVTHLHSDHTVGYPDLIFTGWTDGRTKPLEVYGPEGIINMTAHIMAAYQQDIYLRIYGLEPVEENKNGYNVNAHEIEPGIVYQDSNVTVQAFLVDHGNWPQAYGYKFITPDRTIVIAGDCRPSASVVENCDGCDVLIHEVYSAVKFEDWDHEGWKTYFRSFHTSTFELAEIASKAKPKLLILYHQIFSGATEAELLSEIQQKYDGKVVSGKDLEVY